MTKIVNFEPRKPKQDRSRYIIKCSDCGCKQFRLYLSGVAQCALCGVTTDLSEINKIEVDCD